MLDKRILPESFQFDVPAVEIIDCGSRGLDKTAMVKRASAFDDVISELKPRKDRTYLHVITTGAMEKYGSNRNGDAFNETFAHVDFPYPEDPKRKGMDLDGGLMKYHDDTYMHKAAVYQEHHVKDDTPSGEIVAAHYNEPMHRGELIIAVDTDRWADRLQKKASGKDIYLSMGCSVKFDTCAVCGRIAKTASEHCGHFKKARCQIMDDGTQSCVINDAPQFYDISGVDVPADRIAFVLNKVASGCPEEADVATAVRTVGARRPMLLTKAARLLEKLSRLEKRIEGVIEGDKEPRMDDASDDEKKDFILKVEKYPAEEVIDGCSRHGILLTPGMLFQLLGATSQDPLAREQLMGCDDDCCGDCSAMMRELMDDEENRDAELLDGSFDGHYLPDIGLENILEAFAPGLSMTNPAVNTRTIRIAIVGRPAREKKDGHSKKASCGEVAERALRRTYARYMVSFAAQNDDATCMNALLKVAELTKQ